MCINVQTCLCDKKCNTIMLPVTSNAHKKPDPVGDEQPHELGAAPRQHKKPLLIGLPPMGHTAPPPAGAPPPPPAAGKNLQDHWPLLTPVVHLQDHLLPPPTYTSARSQGRVTNDD